MRRTKLEIYLDILTVLASRPLLFTHLMYKANVNGSFLRQYLDYVIENGLVKEKKIGRKRVYEITSRGCEVVNLFRELRATLSPLIKEARSIPTAFSKRELAK